MEFEWDEAKSEANRLKHGFDFAYAVRIFDGQVRRLVSRYRIISATPARRNERF